MIPPLKVSSSCDRESVIIPPVNISSNCYPAMPANTLIPPTPNSSSSSIMITELNDGSFDSSFLSDSSIDLIIPAIPTDDGMVPPVSTNKVNGSDNEDFHYKWELLSSAEITLIYVKSRNRNNFAALLVQRLFDIQTRLKSNVAGCGKERLDHEVMGVY